MAKEKFSEALKPLIEKITDFFNILDLSFFLSGVSFLSLAGLLLKIETPKFLMGLLESVIFFWIIVICYIIGLICFAAGKFIRRKFMKYFRKDFLCNNITETVEYMKVAGLAPFKDFEDYFKETAPAKNSKEENKDRRKALYLLYVKCWSLVRNSREYKASYILLNQSWVKTAIFDGLAFNLIFFLILVGIFLFTGQLSLSISWIFFLAVSFILALICWNEAFQHDKNQIRELIATLSNKKDDNSADETVR